MIRRQSCKDYSEVTDETLLLSVRGMLVKSTFSGLVENKRTLKNIWQASIVSEDHRPRWTELIRF